MSLTSRRRQPHYGAEEATVREDPWVVWRDSLSFEEKRDLRRLQLFELVTALCHGFQFIAVLVAILFHDTTRKVPLYVPYVTWPAHGNATKAFGYHTYPDGNIDIAWCIFGFFLLSFVFQMAAVYFWEKTAPCLLDYYTQPFRWLEYSISASLMAIIFALLNGIRETTFLYNMFMSFFTTMILGLIQELAMSVFKRTQSPAAKEPTSVVNARWMTVFLPHALGWVPFIGVVSVFITSFSLAVSKSPESPPSWVYFLYSFQFVIMSLFAVVQLVEQLYIYKAPPTAEGKTTCRRLALRAEFAYTTLSLVAKSVLCWVLFVNVLVEKQIGF